MRAHEEIINKELTKKGIDMNLLDILRDEGLKRLTKMLAD